MMRRLASARLVGAVFLLAGCSLIPNDPAPAGGPQSVTDCEPPFAFEGETTLAAIGLGDIDDATRLGMIRVTQDVVTWEEFAPPGVPPEVPEGQLVCVTWPDGSGLSTLLPDRFDESSVEEADGTLPVMPILVGVAILVVIGVSWLAFRRDAAHG